MDNAGVQTITVPPALATWTVEISEYEDGVFSASMYREGEWSGWGIGRGDLSGTLAFVRQRIEATEGD